MIGWKQSYDETAIQNKNMTEKGIMIMKKMNKIVSVLLAVVMVLAMSITTLAAKITLNSTQTDDGTNTTTYTYYQILTADLSGLSETDYETDGTPKAGAKVVYYVEKQALAEALNNTGMFNVTKVVSVDRWNVELKSEQTTGEVLAAALNVDAVKNAAIATGTFTMDGKTATADGLTPGYYLILASNGSNLVLQTLADVTINEKNTYPSLTKTEEKTTLSIGQTETYTITVTIPANVANEDIVVVDTITKGLTLNTTITVTGAADLTSLTFVEDTTYTANPVGSEKQYRATIPAANVLANKGKTLTLTYTANVNENAVVYEADTNTAHLEYDNYTSIDVTPVSVTTYGFEIEKLDENNTAITSDDAEFTLWDAAEGGNKINVVKTTNNTYRVALSSETGVSIVAGQSGKATVNGLAAGTYYLQEDKAPNGYNKLTTRQEVVLNEGKIAPVEIEVTNNAGTLLPSTGGMGTTILYIVGGILVAAAVVLLFVKRRVEEK